jgi:hypothetical protein
VLQQLETIIFVYQCPRSQGKYSHCDCCLIKLNCVGYLAVLQQLETILCIVAVPKEPRQVMPLFTVVLKSLIDFASTAVLQQLETILFVVAVPKEQRQV